MPDWFSANAPKAATSGGGWFDLYSPTRKPASTEDFAPEGSGERLIPNGVSVGSMLWNAVKAVPTGVVDTLRTLEADRRPEDALGGPAAALGPLIRLAGRGAASEAQKAASAPSVSEAVGHGAAALLPLVGPAAAAAGEDIGSGDPERIERGGGNALAMVAAPALPAVARTVAPVVADAAGAVGRGAKAAAPLVGELAKTGALEYAAHAAGVPPGILTVARMLNRLRKAGKAATEAEPPPLAMHGPDIEAMLRGTESPALAMHGPEVSPNAGGKVAGPALTTERAISDALDDVATRKDTPRVTTPPQPDLPPGYQPRSSAPKPKMPPIDPRGSAAERARIAVEESPKPKATRPVQAMTTKQRTATIGNKNYFLRKPTPAAEAVEPADLTLENLPTSWRARTLQDLGVSTADIAKVVGDELESSGLSADEVMADVSKNTQLPAYVRIQLLDALNKARRKAS